MIETLLKIVQPGNPRNITNWDRYVLSLGLRTEPFRTRFILAPFNHSPLMNLLMELLLNLDVKFMLKLNSDFDRYTQYIDPMADNFRSLFDPVHNQNVYKLFSGQLNSTVPTYILNAERVRPLHTLPMDKPWEEWEKLRPVRILYHDAKELVTNLNSFDIRFKSNTIGYVVYVIDIPTVLMQWIKFTDHCNRLGQEARVEFFLQNHVVAHWFDDLRRIWIMNILLDAIDGEIDFSHYTSDPIIAPESLIKPCIGDMYKVINDARAKNLRLNDFLSTDWFGTTSVYKWMCTLLAEYTTPQLRQYTFLKFMSEYPYVKYVIKANHLIGTHDSCKMNRDLLYLIRRYTDANIYNNILNIPLRDKIHQEIENLRSLTNKNPYL